MLVAYQSLDFHGVEESGIQFTTIPHVEGKMQSGYRLQEMILFLMTLHDLVDESNHTRFILLVILQGFIRGDDFLSLFKLFKYVIHRNLGLQPNRRLARFLVPDHLSKLGVEILSGSELLVNLFELRSQWPLQKNLVLFGSQIPSVLSQVSCHAFPGVFEETFENTLLHSGLLEKLCHILIQSWFFNVRVSILKLENIGALLHEKLLRSMSFVHQVCCSLPLAACCHCGRFLTKEPLRKKTISPFALRNLHTLVDLFGESSSRSGSFDEVNWCGLVLAMPFFCSADVILSILFASGRVGTS